MRALLSASPSSGPLPLDQTEYQPAFELYNPVAIGPDGSRGPAGYTASQITNAYGINQIAFDGGTVAGNGAGQTIAIVDAYNYPTASSDLHNFDLAMGLPDPPSLTVVSQTGSTTNLPGTDPAGAGSGDDWEVEEALDIEWAHAVAPDASILLVEAASPSNSNLLTAVNYARQQPGVVAVSMSWGGGEAASEVSDDSYFTTPNGHAGVTFLAATGDEGSPGGYPADSPNVVAVGGTTLTTSGSVGTYVGETGWSGSGGGISTFESQPAYQKGLVTQSSTQRTIPDVSFDADPNSGVSVYDSYDYGTVAPWITVGGTSLATPCWAGLVAIADQGRSAVGLSSLDGATGTLPTLYGLPQADFHDITSGSNGAYSAGPGYDLVTGRGTPVANVLVPALVGVNQPPTINPISNPAAIPENSGMQTINFSGISPGPADQNGETVTITATSSNLSLIPNPTVNYTNPNTTGTLTYTPVADAYGSATITVTVTNSGGTANGGVNTYSETFSVNVTQINLPPTIALIASPQSIVAGAGPQTINLTGISYGPPGNLGQTITISATSNNPSLVPNPTINYTSPGATGTLNYTPSASGSGSAVITVTVNNGGGTANGGMSTCSETFTIDVYPVTALTTATAVTYSPPNPVFGQSVTLMATVSSTTTPNEGSVTFLYGATTLGTAPVTSGVATLNVSTLPIGTPAVTASYFDPLLNYWSSTSPPTDVTIAQATPTVSVSDSGGVYKAAGYGATAAVNGGASLESVTPTLLYYSGTAATGTSSATAPSHAGTYTVIASFAGSTDYTSTQSAPKTFTITPAPLTITANNSTKAYGAALPAFTASYAGFLGSDTSASLTTQPALSTTATATSPVSGNPYSITASGAAEPDYTISYVAGSLTVMPAASTTAISVSPASTSFGQSVTFTADVTGIFTVNEGTVTFSLAGTTVGTAPVLAGVATLASSTLPAGDDEVIATYSDTGGNYSGSSSSGWTITTIAGTGSSSSSGDGGPATAAGLSSPVGIATDAGGDIFIADTTNNRIQEINHATGIVTTIAGTGTNGFSGDNGPATAAELAEPEGIAVDAAGDVFISDAGNHRIREINHATGVITTIAGTGIFGNSGDGGPATAAELESPYGLAVDSVGDVFFSDSASNRIREINHLTGIITTVAGPGTLGTLGDGGPATAAYLGLPLGVAVDSAGDIFIADSLDERVREVNHATGIITTVAGGNSQGFAGDNGPATAATLHGPSAVALDSSGDLFIADADNERIREVNHATGIITTIAGTGSESFGGDNGPASAATLNGPAALAVDYSGDIFVADQLNNRVREIVGNVTVSSVSSSVTATASPGSFAYGQAATLSATVTSVSTPNEGMVTFMDGSLTLGSAPVNSGTATLSTTWLPAGTDQVTAYYSDPGGAFAASSTIAPTVTVSQLTPTLTVSDTGGRYTDTNFAATATVNGNSSLEGVKLALAYFSGTAASGTATSTAPVQAGTYTVVASFVGSTDYSPAVSSPATFTITPAPLTITANDQWKLFGAALPTLTLNYSGFMGTETSANLTTQPTVSTTATASSPVSGNPYSITVSGAVDPNYTISYVAGSLTVMAIPTALTVTVSASSTVYGQTLTLSASVSASSVPSEGAVTFLDGGTILGTVPVSAGAAALNGVLLPTGTSGISATYSDAGGNYGASNQVVNGNSLIKTVAGNSVPGFSGDGGQATTAELDYPVDVAIDTVGDIFILDQGNSRVREINHGNGVITTVAGTGTGGYNGDNIPATAANLSGASSIVVDTAGDVFIVDSNNERVREVNAATGMITTIAGTGVAGTSGDNAGLATAAELDFPEGIAIDSSGDLYISEFGGDRVVEINPSGQITTVVGTGTAGNSGNNGPATAATLNAPSFLAVDSAGDLFIDDYGNDEIREVNHSTGIITLIAGNGTLGDSGDGGPATAAELYAPQGIAVDGAGDVFISDTNNQQIREIPAGTGTIDTVAGTGTAGLSGNGGPASAAELYTPMGTAFDASGDLYIASENNNQVRELSAGYLNVTVTRATPSIAITVNGAVYNGSQLAAGATVDGSATLESVAPTITYYSGSAASGSALPGAPTAAGTYAVVASFAGSTDYVSAAASTLFTIAPATPAINVTDSSGTFSGVPFAATDTVAGVGSQSTPAASLESVSPSLAYYSGTGTSGSALSGAPTAAGTYTVVASFAGSPDYASAAASATFKITPPAAAITVTDAGGVYLGVPYPAADSVNGGGSLESVTPTLTYYTGTVATGLPLSGAPSAAGTYVVVASFAGSTDYSSGTASAAFSIGLAAPLLTVSEANFAYNGSAAEAAETVAGVGVQSTPAASLESITPALTYYSGTSAAGTALGGAPSAAGTYLVLASFAGSTDYSCQTASATFTIAPAIPALSITEASFTYDGSASAASDTIAGVGGQLTPGTSLEGVTPTPLFYSGTAASGTALAGPPSHAGTYTVVASFAGSADYASASSSPTTFVISPTPLTITANNQTMAWGSSLPTLTASYSGFVGNDSAVSLTTPPTLATTATATSPITAPYPITVSGAVDSDYTISYVAGQLTLTSAVPPTSSVDPLDDRTSDTSLLVSWSGTPGTGGPITSYTINEYQTPIGDPLPSPSDLPYQSWTTADTSTTVPVTAGYVYSFTSRATDTAYSKEPLHAALDTTVTIQALPWQNPTNPLDVLDEGAVVPADALAIIDYLNLHPGDSSLPAVAPGNADYYDVLGQGSVVPADALAVIDYLNLNPVTPSVSPAALPSSAAVGSTAAESLVSEAATAPVVVSPGGPPSGVAVQPAAVAAGPLGLVVTPASLAVNPSGAALPAPVENAPPVSAAALNQPATDSLVRRLRDGSASGGSDRANAIDAALANPDAEWWN